MDAYARQAKAGGADLVVFPEATMRAFGNSLLDIAEPLDGPWAARVRALAAELGIVIVAGMFTPAPPATAPRCATPCWSPAPASRPATTRSICSMPSVSPSRTRLTPAPHPVTFELDGVTFGLATCYDVRFPDLFTENADRGADVNIVCASWGSGPGKADQWKLLARARALDSTTVVLACGQGDPASVGHPVKGSAPTGVGHSVVVSPMGDVLEELDGAPGLLFADLDTAAVQEARTKLPVLANRHKF